MEDTWFYERLFFEMVIVIGKDKKHSIKDTMSIEISFMRYLHTGGVKNHDTNSLKLRGISTNL